jgi:hypothetical protein
VKEGRNDKKKERDTRNAKKAREKERKKRRRNNYWKKETTKWAVPWLRRLVGDLATRRLWPNSRTVHVGFVVDEEAPEHFSVRVLRFARVSTISPMLHTHSLAMPMK